ncbi:MAG: efflux RND transporter periplasmic adaptor subunit [Desulfosarcina sp.]|nr:efflux RND transporter periplasmic adaptor subunit [Desulfosarcina sp.]MBC2744949.1 efflux RND transporter periplasmic adaptor subunit [Desulfosarcina sp.]MBC2767857.1 efflux RND transporter periplasmic adaptor subunit [Desulfosarcina sp.]
MFAKQIIIAFAAAAITLALNTPAALVRDRISLSSLLGPATVHAQEALKAGMVDPKTGKKIKYWAAPMDPTYIRNQPGKSPMGMDLVPVYEEEGEEKEPSSTIRIDPVTQQNMGVRLGRVEKKHLSKSIRTFGTITYDETGLYSVNTKFNGWIETLYVDFLGERVEKGQPLFDIYSPDLLTAQQEYLIAIQQQKGLNRNAPKGADRLLDASRTRLVYWDLTDEQITQLETAGEIRKAITIFSPASGVVIKKKALKGHYVKAGEHQYEIADLSTVWVDVDVYEYELPWVHKGMPAEMELAYLPGKRYAGEVLFIYPYLDPKTRTARLRLSFANPDNKLKPGMYANIYLKSTLPGKRLVVPQEAVIDSGVRKRVFVSRGKGKFEPREVTIGVEGNDYMFEVIDGLSEGEEIVLSGQFMLDSESRLKEAIAKMLDVRSKGTGGDADDLEMDDMTMGDDDLDMSDMTMDSDGSAEKETTP